MSEPAFLTAEALGFYQELGEAVRLEEQPLDRAVKMVRSKAYRWCASPQTLTDLAGQARQAMHQSPWRAYILATLAYGAACAWARARAIRAQCALVLSEVNNRLGQWDKSIELASAARAMFTHTNERRSAARCYLNMAIAHHQLNRNAEALRHCEEAQDVFRQAGDALGLAECALVQAGIWRAQGHYREAHQWASRAREQFAAAQSTIDMTRCDLELGYIQACEQHHDQAMMLLNNAVQVFLQAGAPIDAAGCYRIQALVYLDLGEYQLALKVLDAACRIYGAERMQAALRSCRRNIANAYRRLGRSDEALELYVRLREEFAALGMAIDVANCDMNIALTYKDQNRYTEALPFFRRAATACLAAGLKIHAARCQTNMALAEEMLGDFDRALEEHQRARDIFATAGQAVNTAHCEENMARIYIITHQYDRALELLQRAQHAFAGAGAPLLVAANLTLQAQVYRAETKYDLAQALLERARAAYAAEQVHVQEAVCLMHLAELAQVRGELGQATLLYQQARHEFLNRQRRINVALCELGLGEVSLGGGDDWAAQRWFESALAVLGPNFPDYAWRAQYGLARSALRHGEPQQSLDYYRGAIDSIRRGRGGFYTARGSSAFFAARRYVYDEALALALDQGSAAQALEIVEQSKAQAYLALLYNPAAGLRPRAAGDVFDDVLAQEQELRARCDRLQDRLCGSGANLPPADESPAVSQDMLLAQLADARRAHEEILARLFRTRPAWASLAHPPPFTLDLFRGIVRREWGNRYGALVYYVTKEELTILYLDAETTLGWTQAITAFERKLLEICASAHETRWRAVYQDRPAGQRGSQTDLAFLRQLYQILIPKPVRERLSPDRLLIVVPHGMLHALPFHALQSPDGRYLVQQAMVIYTPSLHILQLLLEHGSRRRRHSQGSDASSALVVGVGDFGHRAPPLPGALVESLAVHKLLRQTCTLRLNAEASRAALLAMEQDGTLRRYRIVHFATHTVFEEEMPLQSRVLMHDGAVTAADFFDLTLDADLVVLSSCEGARGDVNVGDELIGLAQALFHAGARALVAGLWKASDERTCILMTRFYQALRTGQAPVHALRAAQLHMISAGYSPFDWAPFVLMGHPGHALVKA